MPSAPNMWNSDGCIDSNTFEKIVEGWERSETGKRIPYYVHHDNEKTQWDHPLLVKYLEEMGDIDGVKYAAYRTAMKMRLLQKRLGLDHMDLQALITAFGRHGYRGQSETSIDCGSLFTILVDAFKACYKRSAALGRLDPDTMAEVLLNWILNMFDGNRTGSVSVRAAKVVLVALCSAKLSDKYRCLFKLLCTSANLVSRKHLALLLQDFMQMTELLGESLKFGGMDVRPAVDNCFAVAWNEAGVTEDEFLSWMLKEPQTIVWLPTMHRMAAAETVKHEAKCSICKGFPIIGLRYRCLKCFNYDLCQLCFLTGRVSKKHKLKHPTQEYCFGTTPKDDTKDFMRTVRNNLSKRHRKKQKSRFLPIYGAEQAFNQRYNSDEDSDGVKDHVIADQPITVVVEPRHVAKLSGAAVAPSGEVEKENLLQLVAPKPRLVPPLAVPGQVTGVPDDPLGYEKLIQRLELENRLLMRELTRRQWSGVPRGQWSGEPPRGQWSAQPRPRPPAAPSSSGSDREDWEREWLRDERDKLEAKQEVLLTHNQQLELQLQRLRLLMREDDDRSPLGSLSMDAGTINQRALQSATPSRPPPAYEAHPPSGLTPAGHQSLLIPRPSGRQSLGVRQPGCGVGGAADLTVDITYGGLGGGGDPDLGRTRCSLPSPSASRRYPDEEAELQDMMDRLNQTCPLDAAQTSAGRSQGALDEMYRAAHKIGEAFTGFVGQMQKKGYQDLASVEQLSDSSGRGSTPARGTGDGGGGGDLSPDLSPETLGRYDPPSFLS